MSLIARNLAERCNNAFCLNGCACVQSGGRQASIEEPLHSAAELCLQQSLCPQDCQLCIGLTGDEVRLPDADDGGINFLLDNPKGCRSQGLRIVSEG